MKVPPTQANLGLVALVFLSIPVGLMVGSAINGGDAARPELTAGNLEAPSKVKASRQIASLEKEAYALVDKLDFYEERIALLEEENRRIKEVVREWEFLAMAEPFYGDSRWFNVRNAPAFQMLSPIDRAIFIDFAMDLGVAFTEDECVWIIEQIRERRIQGMPFGGASSSAIIYGIGPERFLEAWGEDVSPYLHLEKSHDMLYGQGDFARMMGSDWRVAKGVLGE